MNDSRPADDEPRSGLRSAKRIARRARRTDQKKFSRPVRLALWVGAPAVLWAAIYFGVRELL